ncbi:MAG TPA: SRPBCC family protein [Anaerolineae bacterium]|nr:SRPBCC family protein [Anaerolineae bacterium]
MNKAVTWLYGAGIGAGLMYIFDPERGRRRRALARDQMIRSWRSTGDLIDKASRDLQNRTKGLMAEAKSRIIHEPVSDVVLAERVRSTLGRVVSHPGALSVMVDQGRVTLAGPILAHEVDRLLVDVATTRGVTDIENRLEVHQQVGDVPGLQGGAGRREAQFELMQQNWTPAIRLLAASGGGILTLWAFMRGGLIGIVGSMFGLGLATRAIANTPLRRLVGLQGGRRVIDFHKTLTVYAPVEEVFRFWENYENFPRFMSNVREVKDRGNGQSHWVVEGPVGTTVEWDATLTKLVPNRVLAWKSLPGALVGHAGIVHFTPISDDGTQVDVRMSYHPPVGAIGHTLASLFGSNPKQVMDQDLVRFKSLLEQGKTSANGQTVTRQEMVGETTQ